MTFEILTPTDATLTSVTPRTEKHGDEDVFAISLGLSITGANTMLDALSPTLRHALYMAVPDQEQLPGVDPATPLLRCKVLQEVKVGPSNLEGWTLNVDHGIDETDPITLGGCKVDKFVVQPSEGGTVVLKFRIGSNDIDATEAGLLCSHLGQQISFTLTAPAIKKGDVIDGSTEAFKADHPGADAGQGSLLDDDAQTPVGALAASLEAGGSVEVTMPDGARATITRRSEPDDDDSEGGTTDPGAAEQAELEAGMREQMTAAGVTPKRGAAKVH